MRIAVLAGIALLAAQAAFAQPQLTPPKPEPLAVRFVNSPFKDIVGFVAKYSGIDVRIDETVPAERLNRKITVHLEKASVTEMLNTLTHLADVSYEVLDPKTVRIYVKP
jgi:type II secretory pathway component GspD/PulD (secretin)